MVSRCVHNAWQCFRDRFRVDEEVKGVLDHTVVPENVSGIVPKATTKLIVQLGGKNLPDRLVKQICDLKNLHDLDLSGCGDLEVLPAAFGAYGVGQRLHTLLLGPKLNRALPAAAFDGQWPPSKKLAAILVLQRRRQAIVKLATQQEPMLTTLERLSWLLIILATITLTAFLQPGMEAVAAGNAVKMDASECLDNAGLQFEQHIEHFEKNVTWPLAKWEATRRRPFPALQPGSAASFLCICTTDNVTNAPAEVKQLMCGNTSLPEVFKPDMTSACMQLATHVKLCSSKLLKIRRAAPFAFLTVLSFCFTLMCLMLIVIVSLPRLKCANLEYEAGRLWLFLLVIWLLFVEAVQLAFLAFWAFALAVYDPVILSLFFPGTSALPLEVEAFESIGNYQAFRPYMPGLFWLVGWTGASMAILATWAVTAPALIVVCIYFAGLYPGKRAIQLACCSCTCRGPTQDFVMSYESRDVQENGAGIPVDAWPLTAVKVE